MKLEINGDFFASPATAHDIEKGLSQLKGDGDSFAILSLDDMTYIQTSGWPEIGFDLEYQAGSLEEHYRCVDDRLPIETVRDAFNSYLAQNHRYLTLCEWRRYDL